MRRLPTTLIWPFIIAMMLLVAASLPFILGSDLLDFVSHQVNYTFAIEPEDRGTVISAALQGLATFYGGLLAVVAAAVAIFGIVFQVRQQQRLERQRDAETTRRLAHGLVVMVAEMRDTLATKLELIFEAKANEGGSAKLNPSRIRSDLLAQVQTGADRRLNEIPLTELTRISGPVAAAAVRLESRIRMLNATAADQKAKLQLDPSAVGTGIFSIYPILTDQVNDCITAVQDLDFTLQQWIEGDRQGR